MKHGIPASVKAEHEELHADLEEASRIRGKVGEAAEAVAKILHPHFAKEEEYALPPLELLPTLSKGRISPGMRGMIAMSERLKADLPQMLREHRQIVAALNKLARAAKKARKPEQLRFSEKLILHAQNEEEILYPAAILVGEYLKMKLRRK